MEIALITGCGGSQGRDVAAYLSELDYAVGVQYDADKEIAQETVDQIVAAGGRACALHADLADRHQADTLVARTAEALSGPVTCLVNAALNLPAQASGDVTPERAALALMNAMARQSLAVRKDSSGEFAAPGIIVNLMASRTTGKTAPSMTQRLTELCLWDITRTGAETLAPVFRVNAIGLNFAPQSGRRSLGKLAQPAHGNGQKTVGCTKDLIATLDYILSAKAVTGQLFRIDVGLS